MIKWNHQYPQEKLQMIFDATLIVLAVIGIISVILAVGGF